MSIWNDEGESQDMENRTAFEPLRMVPGRLTEMPQTFPVQSREKQPRNRLTLFAPVFTAAFLFLILLGLGAFDRTVLYTRADPRIPGESPPEIPVLRASLASSPDQNLVLTRHRTARRESLSRIAYQYGLNPATLISVNQLTGQPAAGTWLMIPYTDGIRAAPDPGESRAELAERYGFDSDDIQQLPNSDDFFIPGAAEPELISAELEKDVFLSPLTGRVITAFGESTDALTGISYTSEGIDLSAKTGTVVRAARSGQILRTGHHSAFGLYTIVSHSGGWQTFYGHLSRLDVSEGENVGAGMSLGRSGRSGTAHSPRLYFALIRNGEPVDPLDYLY